LTQLDRQIAFLRDIDKLKNVIRQAKLADLSRYENTAEHSWHVAMAALTLAEYAPPGTDMAHVVRLLLIHDIIEIDAGDTYAYDVAGHADKLDRETRAAERIYGLLPPEQGAQFMAWWQEFEDVTTPEARFANAMDQIMPTLHNYWSGGGSWQAKRPTYEQVFERTQRRIGSASDELWQYVQQMLTDAVARGWLQAPQTLPIGKS
jgi:putative hydrolase of HD superfamily